jgi:branched-subunit amino acid transport protein
MDQSLVAGIILGMAAVTYLPRFLPALFLSRKKLPPKAAAFLKYVPPAVLAAMLFPMLLLPQGALDIGFGNLFLYAAAPTALVAYYARSLVGSVLAGMAVVAVVRFIFCG